MRMLTQKTTEKVSYCEQSKCDDDLHELLRTGNGDEEEDSGMRRSTFGAKASYTALR